MAVNRPEFDRYVRNYYDWKYMDRAIYAVCAAPARSPNEREDKFKSSAQLVALTYRALIGRGWAVRPIATALGEWARSSMRWIDNRLQLLGTAEVLTPDRLSRAVVVHGDFCHYLRATLPRGRKRFWPVSFVSKWLHFHCPGVPIYDSRSIASLKRLGVTPAALSLDKYKMSSESGKINKDYHAFCERLLTLTEALGRPRVTARQVDVFLYGKGERTK